MDRYNFLNERQREAVFTTEGPVLILAGAGSGKTSVLTNRLGYMIEEKKINPSQIMAITFTNKAAKEMKERAKKIAGDKANGVWISTFHSSCVKILRKTAHLLGYKQGFTIYDTDDTKAVIKEILKKLNIKAEKGEIKTYIAAISKAKRKMMNPTQYSMDVKDNYNLRQIAILYREYQSVLYKNNAMDFDDLIFNTILIFRRYPKVLATYQEMFHYIMVDEYQDTDMLQFELISKIADKYKNICVVGDDDQSIYKFRGADIRNILDFEKKYQDTKIIKLEENYRSVGNILKAANAVIKNNTMRKEKSLWTSKENGEPIHYNQFEDAFKESAYIVNMIKEKAAKGKKYSDFAILYRMNAQSRYFEEALVKADIPYEIAGGISFYARKEIKDIIAYLHAISNPDDDLYLKRIINIPQREIGKTTIEKVQLIADANKISFNQAIRLNMDKMPKLRKFVELLDTLIERESKMSIEEFTRSLITTIQYTQYLKKYDEKNSIETDDRIRNIHELINKIEIYEKENENTTLEDFLNEISLLSDVDALKKKTEKVVLMTVHSSKGLEFDTVFIIGMEDGVFPMSQCMYEAELMEEERRLAYVAITRAKKELYISCANKRMINGNMQYGITSEFVAEIPQNLLTQPVLDRQLDDYDDTAKMFIFKKQIEKRKLYPCMYTCLCGGVVKVQKEGNIITCECNQCHFKATDIVSCAKNADYLDKTSCIAYVAGSFNSYKRIYGSGVIFQTFTERKMYKAVESKEYMASLKELAGEMNAVLFSISKAIKENMKNITIHYKSENIENLVTGIVSANNDELQAYVRKILQLKEQINIMFVKYEDRDERYMAAKELAEKVAGNLEIEAISKKEIENRAIAYGVSPMCLEEIERFNMLTEKSDEDYLNLKTYGLDQLSQYAGRTLREMISLEELACIIREIEEPRDVDSCIRWVLRGLSIEDAVKKTLLQERKNKKCNRY